MRKEGIVLGMVLGCTFSLQISTVHAQGVGIGSTSFTPAPSAVLEVQSSTKGILLPRLNNTERNGISSPATGLTIYNLDTDHYEYWDGSQWVEISTADDIQAATGPTGPTGPTGADGATGATGPLVSGSIYETLRHNGITWIANNALRSNGVSVGIGTSPSVYPLDVNGIANMTGFRMPTNAGTGKVLISNDMNGAGAWVDPTFFCDVCDPPEPDPYFVISENDSSLAVVRQPDNTAAGIVIGSLILGDPDIDMPEEWTSRMFFDVGGTRAFRAGVSDNGAWNVANLGDTSFATGHNTVASGLLSMAMGDRSVASGQVAFAVGQLNTASGAGSVSIGTQNTSSASGALAMGFDSDATANYAVSIGNGSTASGVSSTALAGGTAQGQNAVSLAGLAQGLNTVALMGGQATADWSMAHGQFTQSTGTRSLALGYGLLAKSGQETVLGAYNTDYSPASTTGWDAADRLLVVGNGDFFNRSDAVVVKKSGRTGIGSDVTQAQLHVSGEDGLLVTGTHGSGADVEVSGAGTRLFFNPRKSAFRAGAVSSASWDNANVGNYSFASGNNVMASGDNSSALGNNNLASGNGSMAWGQSNVASGSTSLAGGFSSDATGNTSVAIGGDVAAPSAYEAVFGRWNTDYTPASTTTWNTADRLFVVGNGTATGSRSDAMVILKNGNVGMGNMSVPQYPLHVRQSASGTALNLHTTNVGGNTETLIRFTTTTGNPGDSTYSAYMGGIRTNLPSSGSHALVFGTSTGTGAPVERMRIDPSGNVGIGATAPSAPLTILGGNWNLSTTDGDLLIGSGSHKFKVSMSTGGAGAGIARINSMSLGTAQSVRIGTAGNDVLTVRGNNVGIGDADPSYQLALSTNSAAKPTSSAWTVTSDERLKMDVRPFTDGLALVEAIEPVWFTYNGRAQMPPETGVGTIAQQLQRVAPYMVNQWTYRDEAGREEQYLAVDYGAMDFVLVNAVKELRAQLEDRDRRLAELELLVNRLISAQK